MHPHRALALGVAAVAMLFAAGCASTRPAAPEAVALELHGSNGGALKLEVSSGFVREAVESALGSSLACDGELDPELRALLTELDRKGPHSAASVRRNADALQGRRRGRRLDLTVAGSEGGELEIRMPWAVAECMLGRARTLGEALARAGGRPVLEIRIAGAEGGTFRASLR